MLSEDTDTRFGDFEPLCHFGNIGYGGTDCHDAYRSVQTHYPTDDGLESSPSFLEIEHVHLIH